MDKEQLIEKIMADKKALGDKLILLAHHYQEPDIVKCADIVGDSYMLAVKASKAKAPYIIMCGVRFMAESCRILASEDQTVIMPDTTASCPMAQMITLDQATRIREIISVKCNREVIPVVYMNSYADMKYFCGVNGGSVCTSSNAQKIVSYYLNQDKAVMFFPDYNLGANTAKALGIFDKCVELKRDMTYVGEPADARMFLWDGFCPIHKAFSVKDIESAKQKYPDAKVVVHPECTPDVVKLSDVNGSTEKINSVIVDSAANTTWIVGTESNFVKRIANNMTDKKIIPLKQSFCTDMSLTTLETLSKTIENVRNHVERNTKLVGQLDDDLRYKDGAMKALNKMIEIVEK